VVGKTAGSPWQHGLRGSGADVAKRPVQHAAGKALWSTRQQDRRGTKVVESQKQEAPQIVIVQSNVFSQIKFILIKQIKEF
jgi:hypothetical protein